jgi:hypothetical protein
MLAQRARRSNRKTHYSVEIFVSKVSLRELAAAGARLCTEQHHIDRGEKHVERRRLGAADPALERRGRHVEVARERIHAAQHFARAMQRARIHGDAGFRKRRAVVAVGGRFLHARMMRSRDTLLKSREAESCVALL